MAAIIASGAGLAAAAFGLLFLKKKSKGSMQERSTTSSAGGGSAAYETSKAVDEYLQFHFGQEKDILPYPAGPKEALNFPARCASLCEKYTKARGKGKSGGALALDVGCAVGGSTFELARSFEDVLGIDFSRAFVDAAQEMKEVGNREYTAVVEGDITRRFSATVPTDIDRTRTRFMQGDACSLPSDLPQFDAVLAANLVCRLPDPIRFLQRLSSLVKPGGIAVIVSPHSWLEAWTPKQKWIGGYLKDGEAVHTAGAMADILSEDFELVAREDMPFLIREHARKYQWGCSSAVVWRRK